MGKQIKKTIYNGNNLLVGDEETGIVDQFTNSVRITVEELFDDEQTNSNTAECFMTNITFIKSFRGNGVMLKGRLTNSEIAMLVFLSDFICYEDCVLRTNGNKTGSPLTIRNLSELLDMKYETVRGTITSLKKKQVVGFHSTGDSESGTSIKWITVNPFIFCRGTKVERWVIDFYSNTEWALIVRQQIKNNKNI